jgi:hypothetical protein
MRPTASGAALLRACAHSFRPDIVLPEETRRTYASKRGTAFGLLAEQRINGGKMPLLSELIAPLSDTEGSRLLSMWGHASEWLDQSCRVGWRAEVAFGYDPETEEARELERREHRDYDATCTANETCAGTADIVAIDGDCVVVYDWKTTTEGAPDVDARDQLEWLALFAARAWHFDRARIVTLKVTENGVDPIDGGELDVFALDGIAQRIRADVARIPGAAPEPGDHCAGRYCKALSVCDRGGAGMPAALPALIPPKHLASPFRYSTTIESPDHLAWLLEVRPIVRKFDEMLGKSIEAYVADGPVTATDGRIIKQTYKTVSRMNQEELVKLAQAKGATEEEIGACVHPSSQSNGVRISKGKKS